MLEATLARWALFGIAALAIGWALWQFLKREPPGRAPTIFPMGRR